MSEPTELDRLRARVDELLEANNREVERRRDAERAALTAFGIGLATAKATVGRRMHILAAGLASGFYVNEIVGQHREIEQELDAIERTASVVGRIG